MVNIGLGQIQRNGDVEKALVTSGDEVATVARFLKTGKTSYSAADVIKYLMRDVDQLSEVNGQVSGVSGQSSVVS